MLESVFTRSGQTLSANTSTARRVGNVGRGIVGLAVAGICGLMSSSAFAGFSTVTGNPLDETSQNSILGHVYGGTFTHTSNGVDYSNGTLSAVRVSDFLPSTSSSDNPGPNPTDQLWQDFAVYANAKAVFAEEHQSFGFIPGTSGGTYHNLFNVTGDDYNVSGSGSVPNPNSVFRWGATTTFGLTSSLPSDNTDSKDHMVTYEIRGLNDNFTTWVLFFDDYGDNGHDADFDYQDLAVELKTITSASLPEPGSLMLASGAGMMLLRRRRAAL